MTMHAVRPTSTSWSRVAARATLAPSVHNTQPWKFLARDGVFEIHADTSRQLHVLDPRGRQLHISCGCAVFNARVALAAAGAAVDVDRQPKASHPDLVARLIITGGVGDRTLARLDDEIDARHTNRRRFGDEEVDPEVVERLVAAARQEGADLVPVLHKDHRRAVAWLSQLADRYELADPAYRAELLRWTTVDLRRNDGVPAFAVPLVDGTAEDEVPIRDFDTAGIGWLPGNTYSSSSQCLLVLTTQSDEASAWARAGEALQRVWLEITRRGYAASPLTQAIEVSHTRELLRSELQLSGHPQLLLRVGRAPAVSATRRRALTNVFTVAE
jgi:nitroreductase